MTIALDVAEQWPQIGRGGHLRNQHGEALVQMPGGKRLLRYHGGSDLWPFDGPYRGDPIHGERGQHVHDICEAVDRGQWPDTALIERGIELGLSRPKQNHIAQGWSDLLAAHGLTVIVEHIEQVIVNDAHMVASNIDRVVST
jgi:hypothetical protein